jgi:hypothetical protein
MNQNTAFPMQQPRSSSGIFARVDWAEFGAMVGMLVVVMLLWSTVVIYPLKILVVFFHELSHGLTALITGGSIVEIAMVAEEGGHCVTAGGNGFLITSAGYLGSLIWGAAILIFAARTKYDKEILTALGVLMIAVALIYVRPLAGFGFVFSIACGAAMVVIARVLGGRISDILLRIIGLTSCMYAVLDIKSDIIDRDGLQSDAWQLSQNVGLPVWFWGFLWIAIAIAGALGALIVASRGEASREAD